MESDAHAVTGNSIVGAPQPHARESSSSCVAGDLVSTRCDITRAKSVNRNEAMRRELHDPPAPRITLLLDE